MQKIEEIKVEKRPKKVENLRKSKIYRNAKN